MSERTRRGPVAEAVRLIKARAEADGRLHGRALFVDVSHAHSFVRFLRMSQVGEAGLQGLGRLSPYPIILNRAPMSTLTK